MDLFFHLLLFAIQKQKDCSNNNIAFIWFHFIFFIILETIPKDSNKQWNIFSTRRKNNERGKKGSAVKRIVFWEMPYSCAD